MMVLQEKTNLLPIRPIAYYEALFRFPSKKNIETKLMSLENK